MFVITYLDDYKMRGDWSLQRTDNNFDRFLVHVNNNENDDLIATEVLEIAGKVWVFL